MQLYKNNITLKSYNAQIWVILGVIYFDERDVITINLPFRGNIREDIYIYRHCILLLIDIIISFSYFIFDIWYLYFLWAVNLPKVKIQCGLWCYFFQGKTQSKFVISHQFKKKNGTRLWLIPFFFLNWLEITHFDWVFPWKK